MKPPPCLCGHAHIDHDRRRGECSAQHDDGEDCECEGYELGRRVGDDDEPRETE